MYYTTGAPKGSTESVSGEARNRTCDPWFTRHSFYPIDIGRIHGWGNLSLTILIVLFEQVIPILYNYYFEMVILTCQ